jgi:hypothetical protein
MAPGGLTAEQRTALQEEIGRHYTVDTPPFERCACGDSLFSCDNDIGAHRLEAAFAFGMQVAKRPKPRRKIIPASEVKTGHEIMSARRRVLVTQVRRWTSPQEVPLVEIAGTYKPKPSALHRVSTGFQVRAEREVVVMNWVPPAS